MSQFTIRTETQCRMLPYSLGSSLMSVASGNFVAFTGRWRPMMWFGWALFTLGYGLMIMLSSTSNRYVDCSHTRLFANAAIKRRQRGHPTHRRPRSRLLVPGNGQRITHSVTAHSVLLLDTSHRSPGGHADQGYGHLHGDLRFY